MRHRPISLQRIQEAATAVGLWFDEIEYRGKDIPHRFVCSAAGHVRMMSPGNVVYRQARCAQCRQPNRDGGTELATAVAERAGGRCLAAVIPTVSEKVLWQCRDGHRWTTSVALVASGHWCPECNKAGLSERQCRTALEQLFGVEFPKAHPEWLRTTEFRRPLELDGYSEPFGIAFEYHGGQHYRVVPRLAGTPERLALIQRKDAIRRELCAARGIVLIEVPEFTTCDLNARAAHIRCAAIAALTDAGRTYDDRVHSAPISLLSAFSSTILLRLDEISTSRGGRCVTRVFQGWSTALTWECTKQHQWKAAPTSILHQGSWCPACAGQVGPSINLLRTKAEARRWTLVSTAYVSAKEKLLFRCSVGHETMLSSDNFQRGRGCGVCKRLSAGATQRHCLKDVQAAATLRGGECLSTAYQNSQQKLRWRCARGHEWEATWSSASKGSWCGLCQRIDSIGRPRRKLR
ncbi:MAG TPA: zinc-ribbon domain-containing protein [Gemmatimonas sp.]|uniref:zinc-ribbon domain-containing protein n=1 Tax=Gemmatimonas sp. TaxID=1962908 RepID=UPI002EDB41BF